MKTAPARGSAEAAKPDRGGHGGVPKLRRAKWAYSNFEAARHPIRAGGPQVCEWKRPRRGNAGALTLPLPSMAHAKAAAHIWGLHPAPDVARKGTVPPGITSDGAVPRHLMPKRCRSTRTATYVDGS